MTLGTGKTSTKIWPTPAGENAYHVETADQAPTIFAQELKGLLAIAAHNDPR